MEFRSEKEILTAMVLKAEEVGLISVNEDILEKIGQGRLTQNQYILFLSLYAHLGWQMEEFNKWIHDNIDLDTAVGEGLDRLGRIHGVERIEATPAYVELLVELPIASEENITIPEGTRVLFEEIFQGNKEYITSQDYVIGAGSTSMTIQAESILHAYQNKIPSGVVTGLEGFNDFAVSNPDEGTHGRNIEEDNDLRRRIQQSFTKTQIGTKACIDEYLSQLSYLDSYVLIPRYDGIGTLKIICDTLSSNLPLISQGVTENCLDIGDMPCVCVLPTSVTLSTLTVTVHKADTLSSLTDEELELLVIQQVRNFIGGGVTRSGNTIHGLGIGENFNPSELIAFLVDQFIELENIRLSQQAVYPVDSDKKLNIETVEVEFE